MAKSFWRTLAANRFLVQVAIDYTAWMVGLTFGTLVRFDFDYTEPSWFGVIAVAVLAAGVQLAAGMLFGLYIGRYRFGSFDEVSALVKSAWATTVVLFAFVYPTQPRVIPLSATMTGGLTALLVMTGARYLWRATLERRRRPSLEGRQRVLVFGAGEGAAQVITSMLRDPDSPYVPVAILDDDVDKRYLRILDVPVMGTRTEIAEVAQIQDCATMLIAIPSANSKTISELSELADAAGLQVMVLPPVGDALGASMQVGDIRPLTEADLLGRHEVQTDIESIAGYVTGKTVLVTGAGGSIGSELCRQLHRFGPSRLLMLDRDESALLNVQLSIEGRPDLDSPNLLLCDIRDKRRLKEIFEQFHPDVVFHAAALKHVPLLETHPGEAVRTNVFGTLAMLEVSYLFGVDRFVNISTDKAADPENVLGFSKRLGERLTAGFAGESKGTYLSVRFGNVLGSRGSMLETFRHQVEKGGPITVTHPEITRFFMTIEEAVQLVIQAGAIGSDGEVMILDMGEPVKIVDVATRMASRSKRKIDVVFTGLRKGEKMHEILFGESEKGERREHPLITHVVVPPLDPSAAASLDPVAPRHVLLARFRQLCYQEAAEPDRERRAPPETAESGLL